MSIHGVLLGHGVPKLTSSERNTLREIWNEWKDQVVRGLWSREMNLYYARRVRKEVLGDVKG